jgi:hypothetical protein
MSDIRLQVANLVCEFDYERGVTSGTAIRGSRLLAWQEDADIALIRLAGETQRTGLRVRLREAGVPGPDERISMIHHGFASRKLLGLRGQLHTLESINLTAEIPPHLRIAERLLYDVPSAEGSSGAPLFDDAWSLVGFHLGVIRLPGNKGSYKRFGFGTRLDEIYQFFSGTNVTSEDDRLAQAAFAEISTSLQEG